MNTPEPLESPRARFAPLQGLGQDFRLALRNLLQRPAVSAVVVATLGLGIAANGILFASLYGTALRPLPFHEPERLVAINTTRPELGETRHDVSAPDLSDLLSATLGSKGGATFEGAGAFTWTSFNVQSDEEPYHVLGSRVTAELFPLLGVEPVLGRPIGPEDDRLGAPRVVLISHQIWSERFAADPRVIGRFVRLDGTPHEVVGVMPEGFEFSHTHQLWTPLQLDPQATPRGRRDLSVIARLRAGASVDQAQRALDAVATRLATLHPESNHGWGVIVRPLREAWMPMTPEGLLAVVAQLGMVGLVLLIVCANVTNVLLAQAEARRRERAVRAALGATRVRLMRQSLVESMVLALAGGGVGALLAGWSHTWIEAIIAPDLPYWLDFRLEARGLVYVFAVTLAAGLVIGLLPALRGSGVLLFRDLGGGPSSRGGRSRLQRSLVAAEYAFALIVLVAGLLMLRSFQNIQREDRGFAVDRVLTLQLPLGASQRSASERVAFLEEAERRLGSLPDVTAAGSTSSLPITLSLSGAAERLAAQGSSFEAGNEPRVLPFAVTSGAFDALSIPLRSGRRFTAAEVADGAPRAIISESLGELLWPGADPLHRRVRLVAEGPRPSASDRGWLEVVGVAGDVEPAQMFAGFGDMPRHRIYLPIAGVGSPKATPALAAAPETPALVLATRGAPDAAVSAVRRALLEMDPSLPLVDVLTMRQVLDQFFFAQHFLSRIFSAIALLALVIAGVGVYGVTSHSVSRRRREMGIRGVLGASPTRLLALVVRQGVATAIAGVSIGLLGAVPLARAMESLLHGMKGLDPTTFATVIGGLLFVGLLASWVPARRAAACAPVDVLRDE